MKKKIQLHSFSHPRNDQQILKTTTTKKTPQKNQNINANCLLRNSLPARLAQLIVPVTGWAAVSVSIGK